MREQSNPKAAPARPPYVSAVGPWALAEIISLRLSEACRTDRAQDFLTGQKGRNRNGDCHVDHWFEVKWFEI